MGALEGKVAIVTGAGRGIGRGEAVALAGEGATVIVNDLGTALDGRSETSQAQATVDEIVAGGGKAVASTDDVASWDGARALVRHTIDEFGRLDILVNNAGVLRDQMSFKMDEEAWDTVVRVHLKGHFAPVRFAGEHWRERSKAGDPVRATVVNTVSEAGLYGGTGQANYAAAKAGIAGMTIAVARELQNYGVTVNAIAPRARTRMTETVLGDYGAPPQDGAFDEWDPDNIGPVVAWLAGDDAADVTGQVFVVFGGRLHLMEGWTMVSEIEQDDRWTVEAITARKTELLCGSTTSTRPCGTTRCSWWTTSVDTPGSHGAGTASSSPTRTVPVTQSRAGGTGNDFGAVHRPTTTTTPRYLTSIGRPPRGWHGSTEWGSMPQSASPTSACSGNAGCRARWPP